MWLSIVRELDKYRFLIRLTCESKNVIIQIVRCEDYVLHCKHGFLGRIWIWMNTERWSGVRGAHVRDMSRRGAPLARRLNLVGDLRRKNAVSFDMRGFENRSTYGINISAEQLLKRVMRSSGTWWVENQISGINRTEQRETTLVPIAFAKPKSKCFFLFFFFEIRLCGCGNKHKQAGESTAFECVLYSH